MGEKPKTKEIKPFKGIVPEPCQMCGNEVNTLVKYDQFRDSLKMTCTYCSNEWFENTFIQRQLAGPISPSSDGPNSAERKGTQSDA